MGETEGPYQMPQRKLKPELEAITHSGPISDKMPYVDGWTDRELESLAFKNFNWPEMRHGDCVMWDASIILISDGRGRFFSHVRTSDADDAWIIKGIALLDNHGVELWRTPKYVGPSMVIDNFHYIFTVDPVFFPAHLFNSIASLTMYHHC
jgi:hypothetical protein